MHHIRHEIELDAPPDEVWDVVGDPGAIARWLPALEDSHMEGDVRVGTMPGGLVARERITHRSDADRSYTYVLEEAPLALEGYESTITVQDLAGRSHVVWAAHFDADDELRAAVDDMYRTGLDSLAAHLDARTQERA
ncbi:mxaD protein [Jatrophihabitans endophyticus]|uniref:MxaD protein n=1 Tax=Jatrophihabitans endophyticus TaxID=1206085 RepID=A0A1M5PYW1_9ACTN|nr:SRPBCC family protein [Jatrophihabitans endophyticus]SHH06958.1 mxaD protein [Jatrophihabitans endophyticus]